jgi:hypothetical protein
MIALISSYRTRRTGFSSLQNRGSVVQRWARAAPGCSQLSSPINGRAPSSTFALCRLELGSCTAPAEKARGPKDAPAAEE